MAVLEPTEDGAGVGPMSCQGRSYPELRGRASREKGSRGKRTMLPFPSHLLDHSHCGVESYRSYMSLKLCGESMASIQAEDQPGTRSLVLFFLPSSTSPTLITSEMLVSLAILVGTTLIRAVQAIAARSGASSSVSRLEMTRADACHARSSIAACSPFRTCGPASILSLRDGVQLRCRSGRFGAPGEQDREEGAVLSEHLRSSWCELSRLLRFRRVVFDVFRSRAERFEQLFEHQTPMQDGERAPFFRACFAPSTS